MSKVLDENFAIPKEQSFSAIEKAYPSNISRKIFILICIVPILYLLIIVKSLGVILFAIILSPICIVIFLSILSTYGDKWNTRLRLEMDGLHINRPASFYRKLPLRYISVREKKNTIIITPKGLGLSPFAIPSEYSTFILLKESITPSAAEFIQSLKFYGVKIKK